MQIRTEQRQSPKQLLLEAADFWDAFALHTSIGIVEYKEPEAVLMNFGVGYDVVGAGDDIRHD